MSDDESGIAAVLAEHEMSSKWVPADRKSERILICCTGCDWTTEPDGTQGDAHRAHVAAALAEAGYGHVGQAREAVLASVGFVDAITDAVYGAFRNPPPPSKWHDDAHVLEIADAAIKSARDYLNDCEAGEQHD